MSNASRGSRLVSGSRGQAMAEYALILVTIAAIAIALFNNADTIVAALVHNVVILF